MRLKRGEIALTLNGGAVVPIPAPKRQEAKGTEQE
jgi:hypothetical protein